MATNPEKRTFLIGGLVAIPLAATVIVLVLKRIFPDSIAVNFLGPVLAAVGVVMFLRYLARPP